MNIDLRTVILILGLTHLMQVILLVYLFYTNKGYKGLFCWVLWSILVAFGFIVMLFRSNPGWYYEIIIIQNIFLISGTVFLYLGFSRFLGISVRKKILIPVVFGYCCFFFYYLFIDDNLVIRSAFFGFTISFIAFLTLSALMKNQFHSIKVTVNLISFLVLLHGIIFAVRAIMLMFGTPMNDFFQTGLFNMIPFLDALLFSFLMTFSIVIMVHQRHEIDMLDSRKKLEESEFRFRLIFENMLEGVAVHEMVYNQTGDPVNYKILEVNKAYEIITGITSEQACGMLASDLYKTEKPPYFAEYAACLADNKSFTFETFYEGISKSLSISVIPVKANYFATIFMDISKNKKLEEEARKSLDISERSRETLLNILEDQINIQQSLHESNELLSLFIKNSPIYAFIKEVTPSESRVVKASENYLDMIGIPGSEMAGKNMHDLFPADYATKVTTNDWKVGSNGMISQIDEELNGRHYTSIKFPIKQGNKVMLAGYTLDITERLKAENEIKKLNETLEMRIEQRTAQLEASNNELEAFSYSVSHDLRAPLRHINGYVDLLNKNYRTILPEKGQHYLLTITESTHQMGMLIDDLLQFSRTGRQELNHTEIDMNIIIDSARQTLTPEINGRDIQMTISRLPKVMGDYNLILLVWINLISNAIKFTRTRETALITIDYSDNKKETLFSIADNGVGFDMRYAQKLFGVFQRLHSVEEFEGTGIGLANVRRIITKHGGRTWGEAEPDKGAVFYFTIPKKI